MKKKWMAKWSAPILALALISACGPANSNDGHAPDNNEDTPEDVNDPGNEEENPNYENTRYQKKDEEVPDNDGYEDNDRDPNKYNLHNKLDLRNRR